MRYWGYHPTRDQAKSRSEGNVKIIHSLQEGSRLNGKSNNASKRYSREVLGTYGSNIYNLYDRILTLPIIFCYEDESLTAWGTFGDYIESGVQNVVFIYFFSMFYFPLCKVSYYRSIMYTCI